jgi:hypothetical protein
MTALRPPACILDTDFGDTHLQTWFERDRAHVCLSRKDRDGDAGDTIVEWWDEAVGQSVEDGFLNPRDWHSSAFEHAKHHGMIVPVKVDLEQAWPKIVMDFIQETPAEKRPREHGDCLEWYGEKAEHVAETVVADPQFATLSPGQAEALTDRIAGTLYDMAVFAEKQPQPLKIETESGTILVEPDGETVAARGGKLPSCKSFMFADGTEAYFSLFWKHDAGIDNVKLDALFGRVGDGLRADGNLAKRLSATLRKAIAEASEDIEDLVLARREWNALTDLEAALYRADDAGTPDAAESQARAYDAARAARPAARMKADPEPARAPVM